MKRILIVCSALLIILAGCVPVYAAADSRSYYPISVEEHLDGGYNEHRIYKVYQLSLSDDPSAIPTEDFERQGCIWHLLDMTRKDDIGVDTMPYVETVTKPSDTDKLETILQRLDAELEVTTEDGYAGTLRLDHTSVQVSVDGYATKSRALSATRTYPNLSDADLSLIPKTIEDSGHTLTLDDVQWSESWQTEGDRAAIRYSATASYTGSTSSKYATGYTVTANYTGEVARTGCDVVTYTAIFGVSSVSKESRQDEDRQTPDDSRDEPQEQQTHVARTEPDYKRVIVIGAAVLVLAAGVLILYRKIRRN